MSGPEKRAREDDEAGGARAAEPGARETPLTLLDVAWIMAKNGYAADV